MGIGSCGFYFANEDTRRIQAIEHQAKVNIESGNVDYFKGITDVKPYADITLGNSCNILQYTLLHKQAAILLFFMEDEKWGKLIDQLLKKDPKITATLLQSFDDAEVSAKLRTKMQAQKAESKGKSIGKRLATTYDSFGSRFGNSRGDSEDTDNAARYEKLSDGPRK